MYPFITNITLIGLTVILFSSDKPNSIKNDVRTGFTQCIDDYLYSYAMYRAIRAQIKNKKKRSTTYYVALCNYMFYLVRLIFIL